MPGYNEHPTEEDRIHCIAFVLNAYNFYYMDEDLIEKMKATKEEAKSRSIDTFV